MRKHGGGVSLAACPSTVVPTVPLPVALRQGGSGSVMPAIQDQAVGAPGCGLGGRSGAGAGTSISGPGGLISSGLGIG